ncbi:MAG: aryl-sulfate sulfotransferase [Candidatus Heimdallarchaeota archaeon]|nr:MAG: aryl-sulfate sulfotransferase [Candidatus Heimdallarchaeota archaeon]
MRVINTIEPQFEKGHITGQTEIKIPRRTVQAADFVISIYQEDDAFNGYNLFVVDPKSSDQSKCNNTLLITDMAGKIIKKRNVGYGSGTVFAEFINSTTILMGEPSGAVLWDIYTNASLSTGARGHHEYEYNPNNNTIFTFNLYNIEIEGVSYRFDYINEYNLTGHLVWSLDTRSFISHTQWCPFQDMVGKDRGITHSNTFFFDSEEDIFYYNPRNLNTFYKIDHKTSEVIWGLGQYGDFTLYDIKGNKRQSLFFHPHAIEKIDDNKFILFDNDKHNFGDPSSSKSRIVELEIDESTMTANESWVWVAPNSYYSHALGDADRLPNGNRLGTFGTSSHPDSSLGARLVEVNNQGKIVWELNFPHTEKYTHEVNRMERICFSPVLSSPPDVKTFPNDNISVTWQTWYNFRAKRKMNGFYSLFLDGELIEEGKHVFEKFWKPTDLTFDLGKLNLGTYNLLIEVEDEGEHVTTDEIIIYVDYHESTSTIAISTNSILLGLVILIIWRKRAAKK